MRAGQLSILIQQTAIEPNFLPSASKNLNPYQKKEKCCLSCSKATAKNRDLVQNEQKKSKPPATALQHRRLCQAVATHEAAICQSIWVESNMVFSPALLYKLAQNCFKMSISDRLFKTSTGICRNPTILSNFREPHHVQTEDATEDFFSSSAPQKAKGRLPSSSRNKREQTEMEKWPLPLFARRKHGRLLRVPWYQPPLANNPMCQHVSNDKTLCHKWESYGKVELRRD